MERTVSWCRRFRSRSLFVYRTTGGSREWIHQYCNSPWVARVESPSTPLFFIAMFMHRGLKRRPHDDRTCHDSYGTFWLMLPRDNEATWINRPGNGMHLRGKRLSSRLTFKTFNPSKKRKKEKDIEKYLKKIIMRKLTMDKQATSNLWCKLRDRNIRLYVQIVPKFIYIIFSFSFILEIILLIIDKFQPLTSNNKFLSIWKLIISHSTRMKHIYIYIPSFNVDQSKFLNWTKSFASDSKYHPFGRCARFLRYRGRIHERQ